MPTLSQYQARRLLELICDNRALIRPNDYIDRDAWARANPPLRGLTFSDKRLAISSLKSGNLCAVPIVTASSSLSTERPQQAQSSPLHAHTKKPYSSSTKPITSVSKEGIPVHLQQLAQTQQPELHNKSTPSPHHSSDADPTVEPPISPAPPKLNHGSADIPAAPTSHSIDGFPDPVEVPKKRNSNENKDVPVASELDAQFSLKPKRADADRGGMEIPPIPEGLPRADSAQSKESNVSSVPSFGKMPNNLSSDSITFNENANSSHLHRGTDVSAPSSRLDRDSSAEYEEFGNEALITRAYDDLDDDYDMETELTTALFQSIGPSVSVAKAIHRAQHLTAVPSDSVNREDAADTKPSGNPSYGLGESLHHHGIGDVQHGFQNEDGGNHSATGERTATEFDDADVDGQQDPRSESLHIAASEVDANLTASWTHAHITESTEMAGKSFIFDVNGEEEAAPTPPFHIVPPMTHEPLFSANSYSHVHLPQMEPTPLSPSLFSHSSAAAGDVQGGTLALKDIEGEGDITEDGESVGDGVTSSNGSEDEEKDFRDGLDGEQDRDVGAAHEMSPVTVGVPWDTGDTLRIRRTTARLSTLSSSQIKISTHGTNSRSFVSTSDYFSRSEYTALSDYSRRVDSSVEVETSDDENHDERDVPGTDDERHTEPPSSKRSSELTDRIADIGVATVVEKRYAPVAGR